MAASRLREEPILAQVRARIWRTRSAFTPPSQLRCSQVRRLLVVCSSSRGGSSIFAEILRQTSQLLHFRGEVNPFFALNGLAYPAQGIGSDCLDPALPLDPESLRALEQDLMADVGTAEGRLVSPEEHGRFVGELLCRLSLQWPLETFSLSRVSEWARDAFCQLERDHGWPSGELRDGALFWAIFLRQVRRRHPAVNPHYYDLDRTLLRHFHPDAAPPVGVPGELMVEEPPFITIQPWRPASATELETHPLVIKSPANAYRLAFLERLFPQADMMVLHLTRNPAASINGLFDGWRYPGFFSHKVHLPLRIRGYSDQLPGLGEQWWKFDLPPGWEAWTDRRLEEVCCFQWQAANQAILDFLEARPQVKARSLRLRFEDLTSSVDKRLEIFHTLTRWLGISLDEGLQGMLRGRLPPVMATAAPGPRRWMSRARLIQPLVARPEVRDLMERLGYDLNPESWE